MKAKNRNQAGLNSRRKGSLERLEKNLNDFKKSKVDKTTKSGKVISYEQEIARMEKEISTLKSRIIH